MKLGRVQVSIDHRIMLRRIISFAIVCASLLLAGSPAVACASNMPLKDCCPWSPGGPCGGAPGSFASDAQAACCAAGITLPTSSASSSLRSGPENYPAHGDPLPAIDSFILAAAIVSRQRPSTVGWEITSYSRSGSALYLSTGRLRL